jgi:hypothetical protein
MDTILEQVLPTTFLQKHRPPLALICDLCSFEVKLATRYTYMRFQKASSGTWGTRASLIRHVACSLLSPGETQSTGGTEDISNQKRKLLLHPCGRTSIGVTEMPYNALQTQFDELLFPG